MRLATICTIQVGYTARSRLEPVAAGGVAALQLRDASADSEINLASLSQVQLPDVPDRYLVGTGDVVFRSRGERTTAVTLEAPKGLRAVAISPLIILRPDPAIISPEYLAWAINLPSSQRLLDTNAQGGSMRMVPKAALDALPIDVPDLATQRRIVAAANLARREAMLAASLVEKTQHLATLALADAAKRASGQSPSERSKP